MESKIKKICSYKCTLILDELEARWLIKLMKEPLHGHTEYFEDETDLTMRTIFYNALKEMCND